MELNAPDVVQFVLNGHYPVLFVHGCYDKLSAYFFFIDHPGVVPANIKSGRTVQEDVIFLS